MDLLSLTKRFVCFATVGVFLAACSSQIGSPTPATSGTTQTGKASRHLVSPAGEALIYSFPQKNNWPANPAGPLALASGGTLYGTTADYWETGCGECGAGAVYAVLTGGSQVTAQVLYRFTGGSDGYEPETGLVRGPDGALYGTTYYGGSFSYSCPTYSVGCGVLFKLTSTGSTWTQTVLHQFANVTNDGAYPSGPPLLVNGVLYGVTNGGGSNKCANYPGCGTIYKINVDGTGYTILHDFGGGVMHYPDGSLSSDGSGTLYGTAVFGGGGSCDSSLGCGAVFNIKSDGSKFTNLHAFTGVNGNDGAAPESGVTLVNGNLYGTTAVGGLTGCKVQGGNAAGCGVIFKLGQAGSVWSEAILHDFSPTANGNARIPSGLFAADNGLLYGTTAYGGGCANSKFPGGCGAIFDVTSSGSYTAVHDFQGPPGDGAFPFGGTPAGPLVMPSSPPQAGIDGSSGSGGGLVIDGAGAVWGATADGGSGNCSSYGCGVVYKVSGAYAHRHAHKGKP